MASESNKGLIQFKIRFNFGHMNLQTTLVPVGSYFKPTVWFKINLTLFINN